MRKHHNTSFKAYLKSHHLHERLHEIYILESCGICTKYERARLAEDFDDLCNAIDALEESHDAQ